MAGSILAGVLAVLGLACMVLERARAPSAKVDPERRARGLTFLFGSALVTIPAFVVLLLFAVVSAMDFGPPRPEDPLRSGDTMDLSLNLGWVVAMALASIVAVLGGISSLAYWIAARRGAARRGLGVPTGTTAVRVYGGLVVGLGVVVGLRLVAGGASPEELRWYGSLVEPGDEGWRVETTLARVTDGEPRVLTDELPVEDDAVRWSGSDCCGGFASMGGSRSSDGLHAWIGDAPVVLVRTEAGVSVHPVVEREAGLFEDRPRFSAAPQWSRASRRWDLSAETDDRVVLVDRSDGVRAVILGGYGPWSPTVSEVGVVARPPWWPWLVVLGLGGLGWRLRRSADERAQPGPRRMVAALLWGVGAAVLGGVYAPFFGLG